MKIFTLFVLLICGFQLNAQMLNGDFESWTNASPTNWFTDNVIGIAVPITQTSDAHSGSSAVRGEVVTFLSSFISPLMQAGPAASGFVISEKYYTFKGWFKFSPVGGDELYVIAVMYSGSNVIGSGEVHISNTVGSYTEVTMPITYVDATVPNKMTMVVTIDGPNGGDPHLGSIFYADNFSMSTTVSAVKDQLNEMSFKLEQNYPNPFNPSTTIKYSIPSASDVVFTVYNTLGNEVSKETFFRTAGEHTMNFNASGLSSGVYFYKLTAGGFTSTKKFILMK
jgi:hypothetical protein